MCMDGVSNQTDPESLEVYAKAANKLISKGTGLFVVPAPEKGIMEHRVVVVGDLDYKDCVKRGVDVIAFRWVPDELMTFDEIKAFRDTNSCGDYLCQRDLSGCPRGCICACRFCDCE